MLDKAGAALMRQTPPTREPSRQATVVLSSIVGDQQAAQLRKQQCRPQHVDTPSGLTFTSLDRPEQRARHCSFLNGSSHLVGRVRDFWIIAGRVAAATLPLHVQGTAKQKPTLGVERELDGRTWVKAVISARTVAWLRLSDTGTRTGAGPVAWLLL
jgi:hypothetical protein